MTFQKESHTEFVHAPAFVGMTYSRNVIPPAREWHIQEHGMTFPYNVVPTPKSPMSFLSKAIPLLIIFPTSSFTHTRILTALHCWSFGFQVLTPKLAGFDLQVYYTCWLLVFIANTVELLPEFWVFRTRFTEFDRVKGFITDFERFSTEFVINWLWISV